MYIRSKELLERIRQVTADIHARSGGKIVFEEYIALPYHGQIILRFELAQDEYSVEDLNRFEALMYDCVGDEFLINFMGSVYSRVGIDYRRMESLFAQCFDYFAEETTEKAAYASLLDADAKYLLELCGMDTNLLVWEIQPEDEMYLFILSDCNRKLGSYCHEGMTVQAFSVNEKECEGLIRAAFYARRNRVSQAKVLLEVQGKLMAD